MPDLRRTAGGGRLGGPGGGPGQNRRQGGFVDKDPARVAGLAVGRISSMGHTGAGNKYFPLSGELWR